MTEMERFMSKVVPEPNSGCWLWMGSANISGYGRFSPYREKAKFAHRWLFEKTTGITLGSLHLCHKCDTPACVNPTHMFPGAAKDNLQDASRKGRLKRKPWYVTPLHKKCYKGHPLVPGNIVMERNGARRCLECAKKKWDASNLRSRIETALKAIIRKYDAEQAARWKEANHAK